MRATILAVCAALLLCGASPLPLHAAPPAASAAAFDRDALVNAVRANRRALVAANLHLGDEEAARFWPLYDKYQAALNAIGDRVVAIVADYTASFATLSNEKALQLMTDYLAAEAERLKVRQDYLPEFARVLPGRTVARFYQLENKMDALVRYDLAATIPVVDEQPGGAGK